MDSVRMEIDAGVAWLVIDRPKALNALDSSTLRELEAALDRAAADPSLRALCVTGAGEKAFVAGADIGEMAGLSAPEARAFSALGQRTLGKLEQLPVPTLAAVNGFALGGGMELVLACDLAYAAGHARFGQPEVSLGVMPGFGGTQRLPRKIGAARALELCTTGEIIDAARARQIGLVLDVFPAAELDQKVKAVARTIASRGPMAVAAVKRAIREGAGADLGAALALESEAFGVLFGSNDQKEGMRAFLEKRTPAFTGR